MEERRRAESVAHKARARERRARESAAEVAAYNAQHRPKSLAEQHTERLLLAQQQAKQQQQQQRAANKP